ncbi:hypothetical protein AAG663_15465 [Bacillus licheniformis]
MDIQKPRSFRTTDRAHADLFNQVIDQLNANDEDRSLLAVPKNSINCLNYLYRCTYFEQQR